MEFIKNIKDKNMSIRLYSRISAKEEMLKFANVNRKDIGSGVPYVICSAENWDEAIVLAVIIARHTNIGLPAFYFDAAKKLLFISCDWYNANPDELKASCIKMLEKFIGNPRLSYATYDSDGNPLFSDKKQIMASEFVKSLPDTADEFSKFSHFPNHGFSLQMSKFDVLNPTDMEIL